jgi:peptidoglycan/xylan/chitin deacetylase (PgdA/CDA1 family)
MSVIFHVLTVLIYTLVFQPVRPAENVIIRHRDSLLVAITLDDAPVMHMERFQSQWQRKVVVDSLLNALKRYDAPVTVFAIGRQLRDPQGVELLQYWSSNGASIGNHTENHRSAARMGPDSLRSEILEADVIIREALGGNPGSKFFRFPFLEEGYPVQVRDTNLELLNLLGKVNARATITTDDWRFEERYVEAENDQNWSERYEIGQQYMDHVRGAIQHWKSLGNELFDRPIRHVLMLHANRINRDYLGQILGYLKQEGFSFIELGEAYRDPLFFEHPSWVMETGTSFLEFISQSRKKEK